MKEVVAKKEMDDPQRKILGFVKKHKGHYYSIREFAYFTKCTEAQVKETLKSSEGRKRIKAIKMRGSTYFYILKNNIIM